MSTQSTGPRSDEGKERSSRNATRHGLCSERPVIPGEDAAEWETFRDCVVRRWLPADDYAAPEPVPSVPEAVARRSQLPARDEAKPASSFRTSGEAAAVPGTSFGNSAPVPPEGRSPGPAEVAGQFVRHFAAGQLNGVAAPGRPEATA